MSEVNKPYSKRPIRLTISCPIAITAGARTETSRLVNISRSGAQIDCPGRFSLRERIRLTIKGLLVITARIQWRREPFYGLVFEETFRLDELGRFFSEVS
ncbi:PilZ domain-containing protein [Erythrobacter sp. GH1-10]|uniref:PilZ domain-containing protein n=1 Tax=Erythrobacter sp. GH1-10 TaxID=3349334 RepID=UPI003877BF8A